MRNIRKISNFIFLYLQLAISLWKTERELRRDDISFDPIPFVKSNELIKETKAFWSKKLKREISDSEAVEIIRNFSNLILLLKGEKS